MGHVLLPGTAFVELALHAGLQAGLPHLAELTLDAPLVFTEETASYLHVEIGEREQSARCRVEVFSRREDAEADAPWIRHCSGVLTVEAEALVAPSADVSPAEEEQWPPSDAVAVELDDFYGAMAESGISYGPTFRGLQAAWRRGDEVFAKVGVDTDDSTGGFHLHPALFDAALHTTQVAVDQRPEAGNGAGAGAPILPFAWTNVSLHRQNATELRVRLRRQGADTVSLDLSDGDGAPVASVSTLVGRPVSGERLRQALGTQRASSLRLDWQPAQSVQELQAASSAVRAYVTVDSEKQTLSHVLNEVSPLPTAVVLPVATPTAEDGDLAVLSRLVAGRILEQVQEWLAHPGSAHSRLVVVTQGATAIATDTASLSLDSGGHARERLPGAAVWGLLRSVQLEHPGRVVVVDTDGTSLSASSLSSVVSSDILSDEPQMALRAGSAYVPRLVPTDAMSPDDVEPDWGTGTVLVTGASGALGSLFALHLVESCGVRRLLLVSRRGSAAPGADALVARVRELDASVEFAACDVSDREALAEVLASVPDEFPLSAVVHCAGVLDDATVARQSTGRLETVFGPKADAALHLHELTRMLDLSAFVLFSSAAGVLGSMGQANYAAANAFVDGLAELRRDEGLPALSLAWGLWDLADGMAGELSAADRLRLARAGVVPIGPDQGRAMFDAASRAETTVLVPLVVDKAALRVTAATASPGSNGAHTSTMDIPAVLRSFLPADVEAGQSTTTTNGPASGQYEAADRLAERLQVLGRDERKKELLEVVRAEAAAALGHTSAATLDVRRGFLDLGFDSLTAVELRNRINSVSGLSLPATIVFDYPSPEALANHLDTEIPAAASVEGASFGNDEAGSILDELDRLETALAVENSAALLDTTGQAQVTQRLTALLGEWNRRVSTNGLDAAGNPDTAAPGYEASRSPGTTGPSDNAFDPTTPDELMDFIDQNL